MLKKKFKVVLGIVSEFVSDVTDTVSVSHCGFRGFAART